MNTIENLPPISAAKARAMLGLNDTALTTRARLPASPAGHTERNLLDYIRERVSLLDFYKEEDGPDYSAAFERAYTALPATGGTIFLPTRGGATYPVSRPVVIGDGSAAKPSSKQNIRIEGGSCSGTGNQFGYGTEKGVVIHYTGTAVIGAIMSFRGPMVMGLKNVTLKCDYTQITNSTTMSTTKGLNTIYNIARMENIFIGSNVYAPGIPAGSVVISTSGNTAVISSDATETADLVPTTFYHNESHADRGLELLHIFRSRIEDVGVMNTRVGVRQDVYGGANIAIGSADCDFTNIWVENQLIAGGKLGTAAFDIGNADTGTGYRFDVARCTYTNLVGIVAGDPNATGLVLRYADNLTFRGGMMYSLNPPGLGYAMAILPPTGQGTEIVYPCEVTISGVALIGKIYRDARWKPAANGGFGFSIWPLHSGDMLNPSIQGHGTIPSWDGFTGVDDRGVFFGWSQFRSWLDDAAGRSVAYDAPSTLARQTVLTQVTGTKASTAYASHKLPANAMRARNSKDYPNGTFPLSDASQYAYDRVVAVKQSGVWFNANTDTFVQVNVSLGLSAIFSSGDVLLPASAYYGAWRLEGTLTQSGPTTQRFSGRLSIAKPGSANGVAQAPHIELICDTSSSVDLTTDQFLATLIAPNSESFVWNVESSIATVM